LLGVGVDEWCTAVEYLEDADRCTVQKELVTLEWETEHGVDHRFTKS